MRIHVVADARRVALGLAGLVAATLLARPRSVLGLPTGRTVMPFYRELVSRHQRGEIDFSRATTFNLDEFVGLRADAPGSYGRFMQKHLFGRVNLDTRRTHLLDGGADDPEAECARYEAAIRAAGGIDMLLLGIGANGHIGFNEPGPALAARTHRVRLRPETRRANAGLFGGDARRVPADALSMGMATMLEARRIVLAATGGGKARAVAAMIRGPLTTRLPASFLQLHGDVTVLLDRAAAAALG